jgi:hypothetical protein
VQDSGQEQQAWERLLDIGVEGVIDPLLPVDSLDQLYFQAVTLSPILVSKVQIWAAASRGHFCLADSGVVRGRFAGCTVSTNENEGAEANDGMAITQRGCLLPECGGFVLWEHVMKRELLRGGEINWAKVKTVKRSIEKSTRSYGKVC